MCLWMKRSANDSPKLCQETDNFGVANILVLKKKMVKVKAECLTIAQCHPYLII